MTKARIVFDKDTVIRDEPRDERRPLGLEDNGRAIATAHAGEEAYIVETRYQKELAVYKVKLEGGKDGYITSAAHFHEASSASQ